MTRAMESLTLTCASQRLRFGSRTYGAPSRFLQEIPASVVENVGAPSRVRHPHFGSGVVLSVAGDGPSQKLKIRFERAGVKTILVKYANLELG